MRLKLFAIMMILAGLVGCKEISIKDGRIPKEYLSQAKQLEGKYNGTFDGKRAQIEIEFDGDRPIVHYSDSHGHDILDARCGSKIDLLKTVVLYKKNGQYVVDRAIFGFHPGACREVRGRTLELNFDGNRKFEASIYEYSEYYTSCDGSGPIYRPRGLVEVEGLNQSDIQAPTSKTDQNMDSTTDLSLNSVEIDHLDMMNPPPITNPPPYPGNNCRTQEDPHYIYGKFTR